MARIGVFDSGVGGLTVLKALLRHLPNENTVYLGDTARVPYGTKSASVVTQYALTNAQFLMQHDLKALVIACNTATAVALDVLREQLPIPVIGVIDPGASAAAQISPSGHIGVLGTPGTIRSGAYQRALARIRPNAEIRSQACPLFVPLAEEGWTEGEVPRLVAQTYLAPLKQAGVDTLVLGCTHYPLLRDVIFEVMGSSVQLVDSAEATAIAVAQEITARGVNERSGAPEHLYFVTDVPERFVEVGARFLGQAIPEAKQVDFSFQVSTRNS